MTLAVGWLEMGRVAVLPGSQDIGGSLGFERNSVNEAIPNHEFHLYN